MDKRLDTSRSGYREDISSNSKKSKKRYNKRSNVFGSWMNNVQNSQNNDVVPGMEYQQLLWQTSMPQNFSNNGQRLFTTASDPSVCGYTPMPMTYTMEPVSMPPLYRLYQPIPLSVPGRPRRHYNQNHGMNLGHNPNSMANGYTSLQENGSESPVPLNYQNGDYASLPPTANKNNGMNGDELNSEHRRYSDPGLGSAETPVHTQSEDSDSIDSSSSITTVGRGNKLVLSLIEQMTELKKSNSQLFKELSETKSELETIKVKLVQCKYNSSSDYQPGMLSDLIREIREANKACEEGLVTKVKSMLEEKLNQRSSELDKLNNQILKLTKEKEENDRRIAKLEEEVAALKLNANNEGREIAAFEEETLALRRELQEARASKTMAENHVAKCVNAVARSVTPVSFESPYITSTPVRTAISHTCSLIPVVNSSVSQNFTSILRSRSAEVAHHFVPEKSNLYQNTIDCSPMSFESREDPWLLDDNSSRVTDASSIKFTSAVACTKDIHNCGNEGSEATVDETLSLISLESLPKIDNKNNIVNGKLEYDENFIPERHDSVAERIDKLVTDDLNKSTDNKNIYMNIYSSNVNENTIESTERSDDNKTISRNVTEKKSNTKNENEKKNNPANYNKHEEEGQRDHRNQKGSTKKSRRKKGSAVIKRSYSETDKSTKIPDGASVNNNTTIDDDKRRTVSEDEDCHDDDQTSRAITEIPEVTVVGGGSFVPKDLCSTGILTSRVLTAPSRATYTTAYI